MKCTIDYKGKDFKKPKAFYNFMLSQMVGKNVGSKLSQDEIGNKLAKASENIKELRKTKKRYFASPSSIISSRSPFTGDDKTSEFGKWTANEGTRYHEIAENVIHNLNEGKAALKDLTYTKNKRKLAVTDPLDIQWANEVEKLYTTVFNPDGKNKVIPELTVANTERGVSGDIDVAVVTPEGKVRIYDYKAQTREYKGSGYHAVQQHLYKMLLMQGDLEFDIPMLEVESVNIIPIHLLHEKVSSSDSNKQDFRLTGQDLTQEIVNIEEDLTSFPNQNEYIATVATFFTEDNEWSRDYNKIKQAHQVNFKALSDTVVKLESTEGPTQFELIASTIRRDENGKFYFEDETSTRHYFNHSDAHKDSEQGEHQRYSELKSFVEGKYREEVKGSAVDDFLKIWRGEKQGNLSDQIVRKIHRWIDDNYKNVGDAMPVKANTIPGMELIGDDIMAIYSNYNEDTQKYQNVDIVAIGKEMDEGVVQPVDRSRTTLAGKVATDAHIDSVKTKLGLDHVKVLTRSIANERLLRVGFTAMTLRKADPDLSIGLTATSNYHAANSANVVQLANLGDLLNNIKILTNIQPKGEDITANAGFNEQTQNLLDDDELFDATNFKQNKITALFSAIAAEMQHTDSQFKKDAEIASKAKSEKELIDKLSDVKNAKQFIKEEVDRINEDRERKEALIEWIDRIRREIEDRKNNDVKEYSKEPEYIMLSQAILQLQNMIVTIDKATDIAWLNAWAVAPGETGVEIIDDYIENVKISQKRVSYRLINEFYMNKIDAFDEFYKASGKNHLGTKASGTHAKMFEPLFEYKMLPKVSDPDGKKVKRRTGRFWPKDSPEYDKLLDPQKKFIDWYNNQIKTHLAKSLRSDQNIEDFWQEGNIPYMKSTDSNMLYKLIHKGQSDANFWQRLKALWNRKQTQWEHYDEMFNVSSKNLSQLVDLFKGQVKETVKTQASPEYGSNKRLDVLGMIKGEDGKLYAKDDYEDMQEINLEHILTSLAVNGYRMEELGPMMIQYKAIRSTFAAAKSSLNEAKFHNAEKFLQVWTEKILQQKNQLMQQKGLERSLLIARSVGTGVALGWNMFSQLKNTIAGFGHVNKEILIKSLARGNMDKFHSYRKAYKRATGLLKGDHKQTNELVHAVMMNMAMGDMDPTSLMNNLIFQRTGKNAKMGKNVWNSVQDYWWRSVLLLTEMEQDGSIKAYKKVTKNGKTFYEYDENLDPRFQGKDGKLELQARKKRLVEERVLKSTDEKMPFPYTVREQLQIREHANKTFEAHNIEDKPASEAYTLAKMLLPMRSWLSSKTKVYWTRGHFNKQAGKWVKKGDGEEPVWEGMFIEGVAQSYWAMMKNFGNLFSTDNHKDFWTNWKSMPYKRKENLIRGLISFALVGAMMSALRAIFDDDDEDKILHKLLSSSLNELYLIEHIGGFNDLLTNPLPTLTIASRLTRSIFGEDEERKWESVIRATGPGKVPLFFQQVGEDHFN